MEVIRRLQSVHLEGTDKRILQLIDWKFNAAMKAASYILFTLGYIFTVG